MRSSHAALLLVSVALALPLAAVGAAEARSSGPAKALQAIDTDSDGTIDTKEAGLAASGVFDAADADKDGTVTAKELKGRISKADLKRADTDGDGTLSKAEFLAGVTGGFNQADRDHDGTLDAGELKSPTGKKLMRLLK